MYTCKNGNKILNDLPTRGKYISYKKMVGMKLSLEYDNNIYNGVEILTYISNKDNIFIIKYNNKETYIKSSNFINGHFGEVLGLINHEFKYNVGEIVNNSLKIISQGYTYDKRGWKEKSYNVSCIKCGFDGGKHYKNGKLVKEYWIKQGGLNSGNSCPCCSIQSQIVVTNINSMWKTDYWMVELGVDEEWAKTHTAQSNDKALCKCPHCGKQTKYKANNIYNKKTIACSCGDRFSYLSKYILCTLEQCNANFKTEVKYKWNKYKTFDEKLHQASIDFIIHYKGREIPLEADGGFHREDNNMTGRSKEESGYIDKQRDDNCLTHLGEETIRISDDGDIRENILNSNLNKLFDLSIIDWNKCEEFALKNLVKEICEYWNNKEDCETTTDLEKIFKISKSPILSYLKKGEKLGWCNYDSKKEQKKICSKNGKSLGLQIEIFKDGVSLGVFPSATELSRQSEELFGVKLWQSEISRFCKEKYHRDNCKGYIFELKKRGYDIK